MPARLDRLVELLARDAPQRPVQRAALANRMVAAVRSPLDVTRTIASSSGRQQVVGTMVVRSEPTGLRALVSASTFFASGSA